MNKETKFNRRKLFTLALIPAGLFHKACAGPAQRSQTRQTTRVEGRTEHRQDRRRGW